MMNKEISRLDDTVNTMGEVESGTTRQITDPEEIARLEAMFSGNNSVETTLKNMEKAIFKMKIKAILELYKRPDRLMKMVCNRLVTRLHTIFKRG